MCSLFAWNVKLMLGQLGSGSADSSMNFVFHIQGSQGGSQTVVWLSVDCLEKPLLGALELLRCTACISRGSIIGLLLHYSDGRGERESCSAFQSIYHPGRFT